MVGRGSTFWPDGLRLSKPQNPLLLLGNLTTVSNSVIAPAAISVTSARYRPLRRSAGNPMITPSNPVSTALARMITGNGAPSNRKWMRSANQAPAATMGIWHSENMPVRPTSSPRPSVTKE